MTNSHSVLHADITQNTRDVLSEHASRVLSNGVTALRDNENATILGVGSGRVTATVPELTRDMEACDDDIVVKFALPDDNTCDPSTIGVVQNAVELHVDTHSTALSAHALPVIAAENSETPPRWVVFPRVELVSEDNARELYPFFGEIEQRGVITGDYFELDNWGFWNREPYLIDYGYCHPERHCATYDIGAEVPVWNEHVQSEQ